MDDNVNERIARLEAEDKNIFHQLDEIKGEVKDIRRLTSAVEKLAEQTKSTAVKVDDISKRLVCVERAPAEEMQLYRRTVIKCIITGIIGIIAGAVSSFIINLGL